MAATDTSPAALRALADEILKPENLYIMSGGGSPVQRTAGVLRALAAEKEAGAPAPDGWIPWSGGECPVGPEDLVRVKCRAGHTSAPYEAKWWGSWRHEGIDGDIVAYRVIGPAQDEKGKRDGEVNEIDGTFIKEPVSKKENGHEPLSTNEWVEWSGGDCPIAEDAIVDVKFGDGEVDIHQTAGGWDWVHRTAGLGGDIVAYRLSRERTP